MKAGLIGIVCVIGLAALTIATLSDQLSAYEIELVKWIIYLRHETLTALIQALTFITSALPALLLTVGLSIAEMSRTRQAWRNHHEAGWIGALARSFSYWPALAYLGALICNIVLRIAVGRLAPEVDYIPHALPELRADFQRFAFPSGHAGAAVAAYVSAAIVVSKRTPRLRIWAWLAAGIVVIGTGFGRVYLGVHWPTDVLAGFLLAGAWVALGV
ncbi:MAG: phosphatase PAP2 family protein [Anaerolineae bacterium]|nr:phosphatase PAP2 family protein [Thermoflexales bacterium]MDW8407425.1 phosphatase PAP2 family protein [Anaerolineae bacterium]